MLYLKKYSVFISVLFVFYSCKQEKKTTFNAEKNQLKDTAAIQEYYCTDTNKCYFLDIEVDTMSILEKEFGKRDNLQKLFRQYKLSSMQFEQFMEEAGEYYDFKNIKPKQKYFIIADENDEIKPLKFLIFKISDFEYIITDCTDTTKIELVTPAVANGKKKNKRKKTTYFTPLHIRLFEKNIDTLEIKLNAVITSSVQKTFKENNIDIKLMDKINQAFGSRFSLSQVRKNDTLQFIYDQCSINGQFIDLGHLKAVAVKQKKRSYYAIDYFLEDDSSWQYVDDKGKYLKVAFLKSPLQKGGAIVSRYNLTRFHPILLEVKPHLGTDFAAPQGAPIVATASGIVSACEFKQYNGNYVKIRHDRMYETQYLHMSKFARGMRSGVRVQQGQVIGYVGSTGLATGPHVCYRFWKNGEQVDPLKEKLNIVRQMPKEELPVYEEFVAKIKQELNDIELTGIQPSKQDTIVVGKK